LLLCDIRHYAQLESKFHNRIIGVIHSANQEQKPNPKAIGLRRRPLPPSPKCGGLRG
jgi:hypothetical protein